MLHAKHLCKLTVIFGPPTTTKTFRNMENHEYFEHERSLNELFDLLYNCHHRVKTFKVVPVRGEV